MTRESIVVCDSGTGFIKCGFAGANFPSAIFPCVVGRPMLQADDALDGTPLPSVAVGEAATEQRAHLAMSYPVENGIVKSLGGHVPLSGTHVPRKDAHGHGPAKILLTEPPMNPRGTGR